MNYREVLLRLIAYTTPYVYDNNISLLELTRKLYKIVNELCSAMKEMSDDYNNFKEYINNKIDGFDAEIDDKIAVVRTDLTNEITQTNTNLSNLQITVDQQEQTLKDYIDSYFSNLNFEATIKSVLQEMTADGTLEELLNQTVLVDLNNRISTLSNSIDSVESSLTAVENDIGSINQRIGILESENINNRVRTLESDYETQQTSINAINTSITSLNGRATNLESDNVTNKTNITALQTRMTNVESKATSNTTNITNLTTTVNNMKPTTLFNNTSGSDQNLTLSQSASNFEYIEVLYGKNTASGLSSVKIPVKIMNIANLVVSIKLNNKSIQILSLLITISNTTVSRSNGMYVNLENNINVSCGESNEMKIFRVIGWK